MSAPSNLRLYFTTLIASQTGSLFGYSVGFIGGVMILPSFLTHFHLENLPPTALAAAQSRIVLLWILGAVFGVIAGIPVCQQQGRRACLLLCASLYLIGAALQLIPVEGERGMVVFLVGRILNGFGLGSGTLVTPMYISEIARPTQRGMLLGGFQTVIALSSLTGFWAAFASHAIFPETSLLQWQIPVGIQLIPGLLLFLGTFFIPESPRFRAENSQWQEAEKALCWLRTMDTPNEEVAKEMQEIKDTIDASDELRRLHKTSFWREVTKKGVRNRMGIGIGLMVAQNMSGLMGVNYYAPVIFMSAGFTTVSSSLFLSGVFGIIKVLTSAVFMAYTANHRGNRFWLSWGSAVCAVTMTVLAFYVRALSSPDQPTEGRITAGGIISVLMVYLFTISFGVSLGPISWNVCAEIFPLHINAKCIAITTCTQWIFMAVIAAVTPILLASFGWITYLFYACCCLITLVWVGVYVPETRGVPLGRPMDKIFGLTMESAEDLSRSEEEAVEELESSALLQNEHGRRRSSFY